ncbi:MAG: ribulose-phosphate 3-epimerase [Rikenellaceae bacterium]
MQKLISPSLLSADFLNLGESCAMLDRSEAQWFHLDIMDGNFVPNISYGMPIVKAVRSTTKKVLDVHLMIEGAERYIDEFAEIGSDVITVHVEAIKHLHRTLHHIKSLGKLAGVSLCPATPLSTIEEVLDDIDVVLLMSVNPGFGGQSFIPQTTDKIKRLRNMLDSRGLNTIIEIDGGVTPDNASELYEAGANCLVAGSAVFSAADPEQAIKKILGSF